MVQEFSPLELRQFFVCQSPGGGINPFPNTSFWDHPKFKEAADDNLKLATKGFSDTDCIENIVEKGEIAHFDTDYIENIVEKGEIAQNEQFHLFTQCFQCVKMSIYGGKG